MALDDSFTSTPHPRAPPRQAFMLETLIMIVKRVSIDPIKFRVVRLAKLRVKMAQAQRAGDATPLNTPELEAIGGPRAIPVPHAQAHEPY